jgi:streptogramin lyase/mono/diheme cytochrome c family protein
MVRRRSLAVMAVVGSLVAGYAVVEMVPWLAGESRVAQAAALPGFGSLSGSVQAAAPFKAARVFIRNVDKRVLFMVYTSAGQFRATPLFPGNYEISASAGTLRSDVQKLVVRAGDNPKVALSLREGAGSSQRTIIGALEGENSGDRSVTQEASYDQVYPPGPGRAIAERTCIICHGENFLPTRPATRGTWSMRLDRMMGAHLSEKAAESYAEGLLSYRASALRFSRQDREDLLAYLVKNFGPDATPRAVRVDQEMPLDEAKLGKSMYIEYYLTPDPPGQGNHAPEFSKLTGAFTGRRVGQDVRFDQDGNVWLTDRGYPHRLVKLDPRTGEQKSFVLPQPANGIHEVLVDRTGMLWLPEHGGQTPSAPKRLLGFNPKTEKFEIQVPMDPDNVVRSTNKWMQSLAIDSKDNIYVGWIMGGALSKYDRQTKKVTVFTVPAHNAIVYGVVADKNDNIWMALWDSGNLAKFDTTTNEWTIFTPPTYPGHVRRLNVDAQNNIWFGIWSAGNRAAKLDKLDQATGRITEYTIPRRNSNPYDVMQDFEGNIWSADVGGSAAALWKFNPRDATFTLYPKPQKTADTPKIQVTRDGAIWYSPRGSLDAPSFGVLYPDMDKITTLGAYYLNGPPGYPFKAASQPRSTQ